MQPLMTPIDTADGVFVNGNKLTGIKGTIATADWFNGAQAGIRDVQSELIAVLSAAGINPDAATAGQFYSALRKLFLSRTHPFADIKADGAAAVAEGLANLGLGTGLTGIVGQSRNAAINNSALSSALTFTVDELIVQTALGGVQYKLANLILSSSLSVVGAGGVDIAGTVPTNGYMAKYAIYNPSTGAKASLLQLCTSGKSSEVYTGTAMPPGYTASALVAVWPIISGQFAIGYLRGRKVTRQIATVINTSTPYASTISLAGAVPPNAVKCWGNMWANSGGSGGATTVTISTDSAGAGFKQAYMGNIPGGGDMSFELTIATQQTAYSTFTNSNSGNPNANISITDYEF